MIIWEKRYLQSNHGFDTNIHVIVVYSVEDTLFQLVHTSITDAKALIP